MHTYNINKIQMFSVRTINKFRRNITSITSFKPSCLDCKNYIKHVENGKEYPDLGKCKKNGYYLPKLNEQYYFYAVSCRKSELYCGKDGKYFDKNN